MFFFTSSAVSMFVIQSIHNPHHLQIFNRCFPFSAANPPCMKRLSSVGLNEPAQKRPPTPLEDKVVESEVRTGLDTRRKA